MFLTAALLGLAILFNIKRTSIKKDPMKIVHKIVQAGSRRRVKAGGHCDVGKSTCIMICRIFVLVGDGV